MKLLKETSNTEDLFEDQTHQKVADTLFNIIDSDSSEGITIGLEGSWGGGKSTIVSLLNKKIESENPKIRFFYFDAWAHEGNPLRRIFLEEMIKKLTDNKNKEMQEIERKISNREKRIKTITKRSGTSFGKLIAFFSILVPFGVALVSGTADEVVMRFAPPYHSTFFIGMLLALSPILAVITNIILIWINKSWKDIWIGRNWAFLQGESTTEEFHEISEEDERSSVEFEKYFSIIVESMLREDQSKLLIVIDNLDRIDKDDSLKIWSTLQTYLQRRNPHDCSFSKFDRVWTLVPYDESGLRKLWDGKADVDNSCSASFFDKCFQLRIQVPRMVTSGWDAFCRKSMESVLEWSDEEIEKALSIFRWYRETAADSPSPREIKIFINQIVLLRIHADPAIGVEAIACFVIEKYLKGTETRDIEGKLIRGAFPSQSLLSLFNSDNIRAEISAILFGVGPDKGQQLLLTPLIAKALRDVKPEALVDLCRIHQNAFWMVFNLFTMDIQYLPEASNYCPAVEKGLWEEYRLDCAPFILRLSSLVRDGSTENYSFPRRGIVDNYLSCARLLVAEERSVQNFYSWLGEAFTRECDSDSFDPTKAVRVLHKFNEIAADSGRFNICCDSWSVDFWHKIAVVSNAESLNSHNYLIPPQKISEEISEKLVNVDSPSSEMYEIIRYSTRAGVESWVSVEIALQKIVNDGDLDRTNTDLKSLLNIYDCIVRYSSESKVLTNIVSSHRFWTILYSGDREDSFLAMLISIRLIPERFETINFRRFREAEASIKQARSFLKQSNADIALLAWKRICASLDINFFWILAGNPENKLIGNIIDIALEEENRDLFSLTDDAFASYLDAFKLVSYENREALAESFIKFTSIENEIVEIDYTSLSESVTTLYAHLLVGKSSELKEKVISELTGYAESQWVEVIQSSSDELSIIDYLNSSGSEVSLGREYCDACVSVSKECIDPETGVKESQVASLKKCISYMSLEFLEHFSVKLSEYVVQKDFCVAAPMKPFFIENFDLSQVLVVGKTVLEGVVDDALKELDFDVLRFISSIFNKDDSSLFIAEQRMSTVLHDPFCSALEKAEKDEDIRAVKQLAKKFKVKIGKQGAK